MYDTYRIFTSALVDKKRRSLLLELNQVLRMIISPTFLCGSRWF